MKNSMLNLKLLNIFMPPLLKSEGMMIEKEEVGEGVRYLLLLSLKQFSFFLFFEVLLYAEDFQMSFFFDWLQLKEERKIYK